LRFNHISVKISKDAFVVLSVAASRQQESEVCNARKDRPPAGYLKIRGTAKFVSKVPRYRGFSLAKVVRDATFPLFGDTEMRPKL
jgi:hypothetical protein